MPKSPVSAFTVSSHSTDLLHMGDGPVVEASGDPDVYAVGSVALLPM